MVIIIIITILYNRSSTHVECESKRDTGKNKGELNYFKITEYLSDIRGNHEITELQKTAVLGTAHILREVLM